MDEFELIERFFAAAAIAREDVTIGIGDDGAVTQPDPGAELVVATDTIVEGTHFPVGTARTCTRSPLPRRQSQRSRRHGCRTGVVYAGDQPAMGSADWVD